MLDRKKAKIKRKREHTELIWRRLLSIAMIIKLLLDRKRLLLLISTFSYLSFDVCYNCQYIFIFYFLGTNLCCLFKILSMCREV